MKDRAILEALENCEDGILEDEKRNANILSLSERQARAAAQRN